MLIDFPILTLIVFLPSLGALLTFVTRSDRAARGVALAFSLVTFVLASVLLLGFLRPDLFSLSSLTTGSHVYYAVEKYDWVPSLGVHYLFGADELSVVLVFLNALLTPLALAVSWGEHHRVPAFFAMFLFMETTVSGVFLSLDLFQFLIFWEVGLVPMYFVIAVWGGPRRRYAAIKFFMYTFLASVPLHTWLPDAHVEAPTGGSVILAGILLKLGGYGLIRFNVQMLPQAAIDMYWLLAAVGVVSILYGAVVCLAQDDLKRMVAFSSVRHMGFVTLGIAAGVYGYTQVGLSTQVGLRSGAVL